jgi:glycosyl transferase family 87
MTHTPPDGSRLAGTLVAVLSLGLLAVPLVVLLALLGLPPAAALACALALGAVALFAGASRWSSWAAPLTSSKPWFAAWLLLALAADVQSARLGRFMIDAHRADDSVLPWQAFYREHSCLSAYTEAARLAPTGVNIYEPAQYQDPLATTPRQARRIGPFEVDLFEYPPPFLLLPRLATALGGDFLRVRSGWFVVQALLLLGALVALAAWIGGRTGARAGLLIPVLLAAPPVLLTLQIGNFQVTAIALAILAMLAFARERAVLGGFALGVVTLSKVFPGVLGLLLIGSRRWRAVAWALGAAALILIASLALVGARPFIDFWTFQLPRINSGEAFSWIEIPSVALVNSSAYGLVTKLRLLGIPWTSQAFAQVFCHAYLLALVPLALLAARRTHPCGGGVHPEVARLRQAQAWLALLSLASFRSPFVPDAYATIASLWLLTLLAAERRSLTQRLGLVLTGLLFCLVIDDMAQPDPAPLALVWLTLTSQVMLVALNVWVVLRPAPAAATVEARGTPATERAPERAGAF